MSMETALPWGYSGRLCVKLQTGTIRYIYIYTHVFTTSTQKDVSKLIM